MLMDASDETLALAAAHGDADAFAALLKRHYDRIFATAFRLCGNRAEAEDLTAGHLRGPAGQDCPFRSAVKVHDLAVPGGHQCRA